MDFLPLVLALTLPLLLGSLWLGLLVPRSVAGRVPLVLGNGLLLGLVLVPMLMRTLDFIGAGLSFRASASLTAVLVLLACLAHILWKKNRRGDATSSGEISSLTSKQKLIFAVFVALLALHVITLGLEILGRPLFPWDATMHWATKARVWYETGSIAPFVDNETWLELGGEGVFTDRHADYPITTPLLQVWINSAVGRWDESLMNLPWLMCLLGLGGAFYGQVRTAGISQTVAIIFTYMLMSMPLLNTHVALAGYADLFLGASYCTALMAFYNWSVTRQAWQGAIALIFAFACTLIKNEGFFWLLTFIPALLVVLLPGRKALITIFVALLCLLLLLFLFPRDLDVAGHSLNQLKLNFSPAALAGIATSIWVHGNWHLLGYLLVCLVPLGLASSKAVADKTLGVITALAAATVLFLFLFTSTRYSYGAMRLTAVGRISLHLAPGMLFLVTLFAAALLSREKLKAPQSM